MWHGSGSSPPEIPYPPVHRGAAPPESRTPTSWPHFVWCRGGANPPRGLARVPSPLPPCPCGGPWAPPAQTPPSFFSCSPRHTPPLSSLHSALPAFLRWGASPEDRGGGRASLQSALNPGWIAQPLQTSWGGLGAGMLAVWGTYLPAAPTASESASNSTVRVSGSSSQLLPKYWGWPLSSRFSPRPGRGMWMDGAWLWRHLSGPWMPQPL